MRRSFYPNQGIFSPRPLGWSHNRFIACSVPLCPQTAIGTPTRPLHGLFQTPPPSNKTLARKTHRWPLFARMASRSKKPRIFDDRQTCRSRTWQLPHRRDGSGLLPATVSRWRGRDRRIAHVHQFRAPRVFFAYGIGEDAPQFIVGAGDGSCESTTVVCSPFTRNRHHRTPFIRRYRRTDFLTCRNCARRTCDDQHHGNDDISNRVFHGFRS